MKDWIPGDHSALMQGQIAMRRVNEARQLEDAEMDVNEVLAELCAHTMHNMEWREWHVNYVGEFEEEERGSRFMMRVLRRVETEALGCHGVEVPRERRPIVWLGRRGLSAGPASTVIAWHVLREGRYKSKNQKPKPRPTHPPVLNPKPFTGVLISGPE